MESSESGGQSTSGQPSGQSSGQSKGGAFSKAGQRVNKVKRVRAPTNAKDLLPPSYDPGGAGPKVPSVAISAGEVKEDNYKFQKFLESIHGCRAPKCYPNKGKAFLDLGTSDDSARYNVDAVVHAKEHTSSGFVPLDGVLSLYEQAREFNRGKFESDLTAIAAAADAILDYDQTRAFVPGAVLALHQKPPDGDESSVESPFFLLRAIMLRQREASTPAPTVALFTEVEFDANLLHGLINAPSWRCGHLVDDNWPIYPDGVNANEQWKKNLRIHKALRPMLWKPPKPLVARAYLGDEQIECVVKMAPPPYRLYLHLEKTVFMEMEALRQALSTFDNASQALPRLIGSHCAEDWSAVVMQPVCSEGDIEQSGSHHALKQDPVKALRLFDTLLDALAQLHGAGWLHRDIFPKNVGEHEGNFLLLDFGNAIRKDEAEKKEMLHVGTPEWCSIRAHALYQGGGDKTHWCWRPRDDLESLYFMFSDQLSLQGLSLDDKKEIHAKMKHHCLRYDYSTTGDENAEILKKHLRILKERLFDGEDVEAVASGNADFTSDPNALCIRDEISELSVTPSRRT